MTTTQNTWQTVAQEAAAAFETFQRDGSDRTQYRLRADAPEWLKNGFARRIHAALDDRMPNDWVYRITALACDDLTRYDSAEDSRDAVGEIADGLVDVYTSNRLHWLADHAGNVALVDEAVAELGHSDQGIIGDIAAGQYMGIEAIVAACITEIESEADRREEAAQ